MSAWDWKRSPDLPGQVKPARKAKVVKPPKPVKEPKPVKVRSEAYEENRRRIALNGGRLSNYLEVACSTCGVGIGENCVTPEHGETSAPHMPRVRAGLMEQEREEAEPVVEKPLTRDCKKESWS